MSERHKDLLVQANAAMSRGDYEGFLAHCVDDVEWTFVGDRHLKGKEAVRRYITSTYIEPPSFAVTQLIADGDFVTAVGDIHIKDGSGRVTHAEYCDVWRIRDGQLAELKAFVVEINAN
ncbi:MAG TPA: nuclear transport factor 2 family protein [Luteitalea sp.]|nr:nuclear transport factor 2 family protein [Luteitalea sp.]